MFNGKVEADKSCFGKHRKVKRGHVASRKISALCLWKQNGKIYTVAVPNTQTATLLSIIREQVNLTVKPQNTLC